MASPTPTNINLPESLPYPLKITSLLVNPGDTVTRGTPLCDYSYEHKLPAHSATRNSSVWGQLPQMELRYGRWECPIDGVFDKWLIHKGETVPSVEATRMHPVAILMEDCPHSTQIHGLCALCGRDMTGVDYLGSNASRATIRMTHDADGPTVSMTEAMRYDWETSERLLKERKLNLIVDLDQTIVHATVDPTVGEWMDEASQFEAKHRARAEKMEADGTSESQSEEGGGEDANPNWAALSDVKRFKLGGEGLPLGANGQEDGSWYYVKPRPGLPEFLLRLKHKYEMHVYTMGTRAYAFEVCKAIDPDQSVFNNRVLTRDESGSMTSKNLQRLFPSDQSMVAIIDDRADIWADVPNLVKVNPYDFFVGIGDINSAHLPPLSNPTMPSAPPAPVASVPSTPSPTIAPSDVTQISPEVEAEAAALAGRKDTQDAVLSRAQSLVIEHVVHDRPLAKMQEKLDLESEPAEMASSPRDAANGDVVDANRRTEVNRHSDNRAETTQPHRVKHKMLLHNNDTELQRIEEILTNVHHQFYAAYDMSHNKDGRRTTDVREFIVKKKLRTFAGLHFTFSNIFPVNVDPRKEPIWRQAEAFGAKCHPTWTESITHVVAAKLRSEKTDRGQRNPGTVVVHPQWLWECVSHWRRVPEEPYVEMLKVLDAAEMRASSSVPGTASSSSAPSSLPPTELEPQVFSRRIDNTSTDAELAPSTRFPAGSSQGETQVIRQGDGGLAPPTGSLTGQPVDWAAIDEEVDAFLNETDDDDMEGNEMDEDVSDGSVRSRRSNTFRGPRKRRRSASVSSDDARFNTGSLLSKRLKLSRDRQGQSGLKVEVFQDHSNASSDAGDDDNDDDDSDDLGMDADRLDDDNDSERRARDEEFEEIEEGMRDATDDEERESDEEEDDDDDDFLARDIEFG